MTTEPQFSMGQIVQLKIDSSVIGVITNVLPPINGMYRYSLFQNGEMGYEYYEDQLELHVNKSSNSDTSLEEFLAFYACKKLTLPSYSSLFSLNAGKIKFIPYQFRPLKKIIKSDKPRLLVADEVGVGKTIETGIILKEFEQRENIESVIIVCPKELTKKWQREMKVRFDETFEILDGDSLKYCLREMDLDGEWPIRYSKCIAGLEMIRREEIIASLIELEDLLHFDMIILDEAHHVVNQSSNSFAIIDFLAEQSDIAVFLSATPIQLKSRDLFSLLHLLDPEDFVDEGLFNEMAAPNEFINETIRNIRNSTIEGWQERAARALSQIPQASGWANSRYGSNKQLAYWKERLSDSPLSDEERMAFLRDLEDLHSFANIINRTKRRDIGEFTLREPITIEIEYTAAEREFYEAVFDFESTVYSIQHGSATAKMIMATIDRLITSCLPAFVEVLDSFITRGLIGIGNLSDDIDEFEETIELDDELISMVEKIKALAPKLPDRDVKTEQLLSIIHETVEESTEGKLLVFSFFKNTLAYLDRNIQEDGIRCAVINGDTPSEYRDELRERFRLPKDNPLAIDVLLSSEVGCEGLDYEFCSRMVNYDIPWNPMKIEQRIGRIDRFGQKSPKVRIYNFITLGTVEERIFYRCFDRLGIFSATIGDLEGVLGNLESDLTKYAFDLTLTESQKAEKAQQAIDNAIRDVEEQREFENNSKELFLIDLDAEDELVGIERSIQMKLLQRLVSYYLKTECETAQCTLTDSTRLKIRLFKEDKKSLKKNLETLRRNRRVETISKQYQQLDEYLENDSQNIVLEFDGSKETNEESIFVSLLNPLVIMALDKVKEQNFPNSIKIKTTESDLPKGSYDFLCLEWIEKGYRSSSNLEIALIDSQSGNPIDISLPEFERAILNARTIETVQATNNPILDEHIFNKQKIAKERLLELNTDTVQQKLSILDKAYGQRVARAEYLAATVTNPKIARMRTSQAKRQRLIWEMKKEELAKKNKADILIKKFVSGVIEVI